MGERRQGGAVCGQRSPQNSDLASHLDELLDVLIRASSAHRLDVELFEALL